MIRPIPKAITSRARVGPDPVRFIALMDIVGFVYAGNSQEVVLSDRLLNRERRRVQ